jgi:DnaJ-class molecular chaperone
VKIREQYINLSKIYHPDSSNKEANEERFKLINVAYEDLNKLYKLNK